MGTDNQEAQVSAVKLMFPARLSPCIKSLLRKHPPADQYQLAWRGKEETLLVAKYHNAQILPPLQKHFSVLGFMVKQLVCHPGRMIIPSDPYGIFTDCNL